MPKPWDNEFGRISPADNAFNVVLNVDFPTPSKGIYVGVSGNLRVRMVGGGEVTFQGLQGGVIHPIRAIRVFGGPVTTATGIIGVT